MTTGIPARYLMAATEFVMTRNAVRPGDLCAALSVPRDAAAALINRLAAWGVLSRADKGGPAPWRVVIGPEHKDLVLRTISQYLGVPPEINPLRQLARPGLTEMQRRVLDLVADGDLNADIAKAMFLSEEAVKQHVRGLLRLLGARNRTHLVTVSHRLGLLPNHHHHSSGKDSR